MMTSILNAIPPLTHLPLALAHSLWLGAVAAFVLYIVLRVLPARRDNLRYGLSVVALTAVVIGVFAAWTTQSTVPAVPDGILSGADSPRGNGRIISRCVSRKP